MIRSLQNDPTRPVRPARKDERRNDPGLRRALVWLAVFAAVGVALVLLYHDADQQDSGYHYLFARWAIRRPQYLVSVWGRPLFTLLYLLPAQFGYAAAKCFTVLISLATAWQTFRLARQIKFDRAEFAIPLLFLQPSFFLLSSTVLTETLFALIFVIALRLHLSGRIEPGALVASLLILVRPEGFFIALLWGTWVLFGAGPGASPSEGEASVPLSSGRLTGRFRLKAGLQTLFLLGGISLWWVGAYWITRDPLWIIHDWPADWRPDGKVNGTGPLWWYIALLPLIVGPILVAPFLIGLWRLLKRREFACGVAAVLALFALHAAMFWRGWFGSAGYARYFVCVSPAIALITLAGWNELARRRAKYFNLARSPFAATALAVSFLLCVFYVDGWRFTRDARAVEEMSEWFRGRPRPVARLICSQAYMRIVLDRDLWEKPAFTNNREHNLALVRQSPARTLVFWDEETGPKWYGLRAADFESAGYVRLRSRSYMLEGLFFRLPWDHFGGPRAQQMSLLYKE
jgi:hypothetical protein